MALQVHDNAGCGINLVTAVPRNVGWAPIWRMTELLGRYLGSARTVLDVHDAVGLWRKARGPLKAKNVRGGTLLLVASDPGQLNALLQKSAAVHDHARVIAWVIDSFWWDRIPRLVRTGLIDRIYVTDPGDVPAWLTRGAKDVRCLPWGTDALGTAHAAGMKSFLSVKDIDILRVGRQPAAWDDDRELGTLARRAGLSFHGRPPFGSGPGDAYDSLGQYLVRSLFVLAFSARVSRADYTHPTADYLTGRWLDALAHGCVVAGARPRSAAADALLWNGSTLEIPPLDPKGGMEILVAAREGWAPEISLVNRREALLRLDWRWRFEELLRDLGVSCAKLQTDLEEIRNLAGAMQ